MKWSVLGRFGVVLLTGAVAAGYVDAPTTYRPEAPAPSVAATPGQSIPSRYTGDALPVASDIASTAWANNLTAVGTGSSTRLLKPLLAGILPPVTVHIFYCQYNGDWSTYTCDAHASGGSGSGYSFAWNYEYYTWSAPSEVSDTGGASTAIVECVGGPMDNRTSFTVTVTDSNGGTASAYGSVPCGYQNQWHYW